VRSNPFYYPVSLPLLQTIASLYGRTLKYLHLGARVSIPLDQALCLLSHLPELEVCRLKGLIAPKPSHEGESMPNPDLGIGSSDEEEEVTPKIEEAEAKEYESARKLASWPKPVHTINLPALRTLDCQTFFPNVRQWQVPSLQEVIAGFSEFSSAQTSLAVLQVALQPHSEHITHFTYMGIPRLELWHIIAMLPSLEHLRFALQGVLAVGTLQDPHTNLKTIVVRLHRNDAEPLQQALRNVKERVSGGCLPSLSLIRFEGYKGGQLQEHVEAARLAFEDLGVCLRLS